MPFVPWTVHKRQLLSFAQFEREVTGERIRDKKRAMATKGMWGNGLPPLGYAKEEKRLVPHPEERKLVQHIYEKYLEFGNVRQLTEYLAEEGYISQRGKSLSAGNLYKILSRKVYIGKIEYKGQISDGQHEAMLTEELFNRVQKQLAENNHAHKLGIRQKTISLLGGILFDDANNKMGPTHSRVGSRKYRYYQSIPVTRGKKHLAGSVAQVGAGEVENFVIQVIKKELENETYQEGMSIEERKHLQSILPNKLTELTVDKILCRALIKKTVLSKDRMKLFLNKDAIVELLRRIIKGEAFEDLPQCQEIVEKEYPCKMRAVRNGAKMIVGEGQGVENATLKDALKKSMEYHGYLLSGKYGSAREIAEQVENNKDERYIYHILNLRFLAADILEDILTDKLSDYYTVKEMSKCGSIMDWEEQRLYLKSLRK